MLSVSFSARFTERMRHHCRMTNIPPAYEGLHNAFCSTGKKQKATPQQSMPRQDAAPGPSISCRGCGNLKPDRFCLWLGAFLQQGLDDDPDCEGYVTKGGKNKTVGDEEASQASCPKTDSASALGPYAYLHFYEAGKVKRKYLGRGLGDLVSKPVQELQNRLHEIDEILGGVVK